jgi:hypothetical protein
MKPIPAILIDEDGDLHTLYNEVVSLQDIGRIENVHRASHVRFDELNQEWTVVCAVSGQIVHRNPSREAAIRWEIEHFQPGGELNQQQPGASNGKEDHDPH